MFEISETALVNLNE